MRLSLLVALTDVDTPGGGVIGRGGGLPWRMSADLRRFKELTMGHHILMGRKTFESIDRLLPGRTTVIITRTPEYQFEGALVAGDLDEALCQVAGDDEVFVVGGAEIYRLALPRAARMYVTVIHAGVEGDTHFPPVDWRCWQLAEEEHHKADERNEFDYTFRVYDRLINTPSAASAGA